MKNKLSKILIAAFFLNILTFKAIAMQINNSVGNAVFEDIKADNEKIEFELNLKMSKIKNSYEEFKSNFLNIDKNILDEKTYNEIYKNIYSRLRKLKENLDAIFIEQINSKNSELLQLEKNFTTKNTSDILSYRIKNDVSDLTHMKCIFDIDLDEMNNSFSVKYGRVVDGFKNKNNKKKFEKEDYEEKLKNKRLDALNFGEKIVKIVEKYIEYAKNFIKDYAEKKELKNKRSDEKEFLNSKINLIEQKFGEEKVSSFEKEKKELNKKIYEEKCEDISHKFEKIRSNFDEVMNDKIPEKDYLTVDVNKLLHMLELRNILIKKIAACRSNFNSERTKLYDKVFRLKKERKFKNRLKNKKIGRKHKKKSIVIEREKLERYLEYLKGNSTTEEENSLYFLIEPIKTILELDDKNSNLIEIDKENLYGKRTKKTPIKRNLKREKNRLLFKRKELEEYLAKTDLNEKIKRKKLKKEIKEKRFEVVKLGEQMLEMAEEFLKLAKKMNFE